MLIKLQKVQKVVQLYCCTVVQLYSCTVVLLYCCTLQVKFSVTLVKIAELNAKKETIDVNFFLEMNWTDRYLEWNPVEFDGVERVVMPANAIPLPVVAVFSDEGPG